MLNFPTVVSALKQIHFSGDKTVVKAVLAPRAARGHVLKPGRLI